MELVISKIQIAEGYTPRQLRDNVQHKSGCHVLFIKFASSWEYLNEITASVLPQLTILSKTLGPECAT